MTKMDPANDTAYSLAPRLVSAGPRRAGATWVVEAALIFAVLLGLDAVLRPGTALLDASPHAFWIPVLAMAACHGLLAGLGTSIAATAILGWTATRLSPAEADAFAQAAHLWREPVLWFVASLLLGAGRDRSARRVAEAERRAAEAEARGETIAAHAATLRAHIAELERAIAIAPSRSPAPGAAQAAMPPAGAAAGRRRVERRS